MKKPAGAKKPAGFVPNTGREILESNRRHLKSLAGEPDLRKAEQKAEWEQSASPGADLFEIAEMGELRLNAAKTSEETHKKAPKGAWRISWFIRSHKTETVIAMGGADTMEEAKDFAYLAYQAAYGVIKGGDA